MLRSLAAISLALPALAFVAPASSAQIDPAVLVRVASLSPWVDANHPFEIGLRLTNASDVALSDVSIRVSFHPRVTTRSALRAALDQGVSSAVIAFFERTLVVPLAPGETRLASVRRAPTELPQERGPYPVTVAVSSPHGQESFTTVVPIFPPTTVPPVNVTWVMRIDHPVIAAPLALDQRAVDALDLEALTTKLTAVADRVSAQVTLAPSPAFIDALATLAEGGADAAIPALSAFRRAASVVAEIAAVPYAGVDLPALTAHGPGGDLLRQIGVGRAAIERLTGEATTLGAFVPPRLSLDEASAEALLDIGVSGAIVAAERLRALPQEPERLAPELFGPSFPFGVGSAAIGAVVPDPDIATRLEASTQGLLLGQAVIAETLGVWQELPLFASDRVVVIAPDRLPGASVLDHALDGLAGAPWVEMRPLSAAVSIAEGTDAVAQFAPAPPGERPYLSAAVEARHALNVLDGIAVDGIEDHDELDRAILLAESDDWLPAPDQGVALARFTVQRVNDVLGGLRVTPRRVTLTARTGDVPLTIINDNPFVLRVQVRLSGAKAGFPAGDTRELELAPGDNTIAIPVEARATGSFPVDVSVETPDGRRVLVTGRLILRSTAVSAVSLAVVAGSVLILLVAWVRRARRRARARDTDPAAPPADR